MLHLPLLLYECFLKSMYGHHILYTSMTEHGSTAGEVANPARGQLNRENEYYSVGLRSRLRIWCRETRSAALMPPDLRGGIECVLLLLIERVLT